MDSEKGFNIRYEPRTEDSKFILFAEMQEDHFGIRDENGVTLFGAEIVKECLSPTKYYFKYDVLYYENFKTMVVDINFIIKSCGSRPIPIIFHEISDIKKWEEDAMKFEKNIKNSLLLLSHPDYVFTYDLICRSI